MLGLVNGLVTSKCYYFTKYTWSWQNRTCNNCLWSSFRLLESHKKLQKINHELEDKLITVVCHSRHFFLAIICMVSTSLHLALFLFSTCPLSSFVPDLLWKQPLDLPTKTNHALNPALTVIGCSVFSICIFVYCTIWCQTWPELIS